MGWVTLALRKQTLQAEINSAEYQDIQLSRDLRRVQRHLSYDQSIYNADKAQELKDAKDGYKTTRDARPSNIDSKEYAEWEVKYKEAQEDYQEHKSQIEDYYDGIQQELEEDASLEEQAIQEEQAQLEAQLQAMRAELETINEQIKSDIDAQKISLS